jgi:hypothetical protein
MRAMPRLVPFALAAGLSSAVLHLSTEWSLLGALFFALAAPLPLFAVGLGLGLTAAAVAAVAATAAVGFAAGWPRAGLYAVTDAVLVVGLVRFALLNRPTTDGGTEWYPPGLMLAWLTLYGAIAFVGLAFMLGSGEQGLEASLANFLDGFRQALAGAGQDNPAAEHVLATLKRVIPSLVVGWWIIIMAVNAVLAQKLLVRTGHALRPSPDLAAMAPPAWLLAVTVAAAAVALVGSGWLGFVATNVALILCVPYLLTGLAVVHAISGRWNGRLAILVAMYLLLLLFGWPLIVVAGLGMVEHWAGLRQRFAGPGSGNERNE